MAGRGVLHEFTLCRIERYDRRAFRETVALDGIEAYVAERIENGSVDRCSTGDDGMHSAAEYRLDILCNLLRQFHLEAAGLAVHDLENSHLFI